LVQVLRRQKDVEAGEAVVAGIQAMAETPSCVAKQVTKPIRNREAPVTDPRLEWPR
jgi:hypothetical protein